MSAQVPATNVSPDEIARFDAMAARWWDLDGPMRPLHRMNPLRVGWIAERALRRHGPGARVLDVGCGAGIAAEALARRGFDVTGLDAAAEAVAAARAHAPPGLSLRYRAGIAEELAAEGARFPVVTALEVIEHVPDPESFVALLARLLEPGGTLFVSTLNRTPMSYVAAKVVAEQVLGWLPVGTHDWRRFVTPAELGRYAGAAGLRLSEVAGMSRAPLSGRWSAGRDLRINYIAMAEAPRQ
jgi:2-polyprenyl-6-hydroxyphenyl methylase/3-demethylubiquinone-9 3-methyltransferase